jgi:hypothetical protein
MPRRNDIAKILVIGSGPIVIGQSAEFDYSGTQACKALKAEGYEVVLVNSNPASIMTDPDVADRTYIEPLTMGYLEEILRVETEMMRKSVAAPKYGGPSPAAQDDGEEQRPGIFAVLPTVGGQTALNLAVDLADAGILDKFGVELIGAKLEAIKKAEDRLLFKDAMNKIGLDMPKSMLVNNTSSGLEYAVSNVQALQGKAPLFGICLGHQIFGLALGGKTYKLKFGHHGGNHPILNHQTGKVEITAQNHNYNVDPASLPDDVEQTHTNLNDHTLAGLRHKTDPMFSVQYHPEASPGPHDSHYLFKDFRKMMEEWKK